SQFCIGALLGFGFGYLGTEIMNRIDVNSDSLYPVCAATLVVIVFSTVKFLGGNGLLAVYITGMVMGNRSMKYKIPLVRFFDGISWLMQIFIFVTLGLLVFPKQMLHVWHESFLFAILLAVVIRPASVLLTLLPFKYLPKFKFNQYDITFKSKIFISWVGLRGASSIVFATYPLVNRLDNADYIFNIVFFVSLVSLVLQGTLLSPIAKYLGLIDSKDNTLVSRSFTDFETDAELNCELYELFASSSSDMTGKKLRDIKFPESIRIVMIKRSDKIVIPKGNSTIKENDILVTSAEDPELLYSFKEQHSLS
ncbi:MAG: cation:proton antiporter, partial [Synergistes sp.]|nr:cation:proton antiporter [Synergistes sp.]